MGGGRAKADRIELIATVTSVGRTRHDAVHAAAERRLSGAGQRHTRQRRAIIELISAAGRPVTVPELLAGDRAGSASQSSLYRNLAVLEDVGVVQRVTTPGTHDRFELSEALSGGHHHHLTCTSCGVVIDVDADPDVERAVAAETRRVAAELDAVITGHSLELYGLCHDCRL
jgi:Fe2+ or Zn2+ uptake regulation protein